ncbi:uncharacterized protein IUM83_19332 [Phytophthora cinnamomi]|uniref:uncharacterized protein n=1 Tax=Phytophthora cinnamomi TaxID=4785 RepID=UPI00355ABDD1|nr:hypothetical protein IUM83_19332 [Phytophthora cinnamomi]
MFALAALFLAPTLVLFAIDFSLALVLQHRETHQRKQIIVIVVVMDLTLTGKHQWASYRSNSSARACSYIFDVAIVLKNLGSIFLNVISSCQVSSLSDSGRNSKGTVYIVRHLIEEWCACAEFAGQLCWSPQARWASEPLLLALSPELTKRTLSPALLAQELLLSKL